MKVASFAIICLAKNAPGAFASSHNQKACRSVVPGQLADFRGELAVMTSIPHLNWWIGVIFAFGSALFVAIQGRAAVKRFKSHAYDTILSMANTFSCRNIPLRFQHEGTRSDPEFSVGISQVRSITLRSNSNIIGPEPFKKSI
jgi:hypothetical protein